MSGLRSGGPDEKGRARRIGRGDAHRAGQRTSIAWAGPDGWRRAIAAAKLGGASHSVTGREPGEAQKGWSCCKALQEMLNSGRSWRR